MAIQKLSDLQSVRDKQAYASSGGTVNTFTGDGTAGVNGRSYRRHTFTASGSLAVSRAGVAWIFLCGGGGGNGYNTGTDLPGEQIGAGGGGGVLWKQVWLDAETLTVTIGEAGRKGFPGGPTAVGLYVAAGGGNGGHGRNLQGGPGGCGGGGGDSTGQGGLGTPGQGYNGGNGGGTPDGGGGGGAGAAGSGPVGGAGITFQTVTYGAGGSVLSGSTSGSYTANTGHGADFGASNSSTKAAASGIAIVYYEA